MAMFQWQLVRWKRHALCLLLALLGPTGLAATEQTVVLTAVRDTSIFFGSPDSLGSADGQGPHLWTSVTAGSVVRRALVLFDLSAIPPGAVVQEARLSLYASRMRDAHEVRAHRLLQSWGEGPSEAGGFGHGTAALPGDSTWIHRFHPGQPWTTAGGDFVAQPSASAMVAFPNTRATWVGQRDAGAAVAMLVQDVQRWVDAPASNHGWIFIGDESTDQNAKRFDSRNNPVAANRPQLSVRYTVPQEAASDGDVPLPLWALGLLATLIGGGLIRMDQGRRSGSGQ